MRYPLESPLAWQSFPNPSLLTLASSLLRTQSGRRKARRTTKPKLTAAKTSGRALLRNEIVLICVFRNAADLIPSFLAHYRQLNVGRFAFVDDRSDDESLSLLLAQDDVDVFHSEVDFKQAKGGLIWRDMLLDRYGRNRWYLSIDVDEYLVFPGSERRSLQEFIGDLERHHLRRAHAPMLDIYPDAPLGLAAVPEHASDFPTGVSPLYDGTQYEIAHEEFGTAVRGGPRRRLYGVEMRMSKFPLLYADNATSFTGGSHHGPLPLYRNFLPVHAVLLHHKFPAGAVAQFHAVAERGSHSGKSAFYKKIVAQVDFNEEADLRFSGSRRYEGSQKLIDEGFMLDLRA